MNLIFAGTPSFAANILDDVIKKGITFNAVYSQPDKPKGRGQKLQETPVKTIAKKHNIPIYQPKNFLTKKDIADFAALKPDLMIVVAYGILLPEEIIKIPKYGCINVHGSILPKYRGASPVQYAILNGDKETGVTIFQIAKNLDAGDILTTHKCKISDDDTTKTLLDKLTPISVSAIIEIIEKIKTSKINKIKQDDSKATYAPKIKKQDALISWNSNAKSILRKIKAYFPWPIAFFKINESIIKIIKASIEKRKDEQKNIAPGKITEINKTGIKISTKTDLICIIELQFPGSKILNVKDVINSPKYINILKNDTL